MNESQTPPKNIVLIGFMGSGKSTVGRELHHRLGYPLVDMDHIIEQRAGKPITTTAAELGISQSCLHNWIRQAQVNRGELPGVTTSESAELRRARSTKAVRWPSVPQGQQTFGVELLRRGCQRQCSPASSVSAERPCTPTSGRSVNVG